MADVLQYRSISLPRTEPVLVARNINIKCIGLHYYNYDIRAIIQQPAQDLANCAPIVLPPAVCDLNGDTNINHKTISDNNLDDAQASTQLNLVCKGSASITL